MGDIFRMKRGDSANRPDLLTGEMSFDTDIEVVWVGGLNGDIPVATKVDGGTVQLYGAKGDGATDDTVAIQTAVNNMNIVHGGFKTYKLTGQITIPSNVALIGFNFVVDYAPTLNDESILKVIGENVKLSHINVDGNEQDHTGVEFNGSKNSKLENFEIMNCKWAGVFVSNASQFITVQKGVIDGCTGTFLGGALQVEDGSKNVNVSFVDISNTLGKGFSVGESEYVKFHQCKAVNSIYENFYTYQGAKFIEFEKCHSYNDEVTSTSSGMKLSRGADTITIKQCEFEHYVGSGVVSPLHNQGCSNVVVENSLIKGSTEQCILMSWHPQDGAEVPATPANHIIIKDCVIDAFDGGAGARFDPSAPFDNLEDIHIKNCTFVNYGVNAVRAIKVKGFKVEGCRFKDSIYQVNTTDTIIRFDSIDIIDNSQDTEIVGNIFENSSGYAIYAYLTENFKVNGNKLNAKLAGTTLFQIDNSENGFISENVFKLLNTGINLNLNTSKVSMVNNVFDGGGSGTAIRENGSKQLITNNIFNTIVQILPNEGGDETIISNNNNKKTLVGSAAPTTGDHVVGDIVWDLTPSASGKIGWVCVAAGTPGTWKTFGAIDA